MLPLLETILADPELLFASWDYLTGYPDKIIAAVEDDEMANAGLRYVNKGLASLCVHEERADGRGIGLESGRALKRA